MIFLLTLRSLTPSQPVRFVLAEALAKHLARIGDDEEGVRVELLDNALDHHDLAAAHRAQQDWALRVRVRADRA